MHPTYYNLHADPFRLSPDPRFCFPHRTYRKAMTYMRHALLRAEGFIIITGQPGMGKTTLINDLFRGITPDQLKVARLVSTQLQAEDMLRLVAFELDLDPAGMDKASILNRVGHFLKQQYREGRRTLLVVDEAQDVTGEAMEELRLLTNIQVDGQQLLQIFLVGQEELRDAVSAPTLVQLHQRVIAAAHLDPLGNAETKEYIKHRLRRVGWQGDPLISNQAYAMIHQFSRGIPRQINQICSRLLLHGSIEERHRLGMQDLRIVIEELHEEMLLPLGMQEVADTLTWPAESQEETYDKRLRSRPEGTGATAAPRADTDTAAADTSNRASPGADADSVTGDIAADSRPVGDTAVTAAAPGAAAADDDEQPDTREWRTSATAAHRRTDRQERRQGPLLLMLAIIALLAGLLLALLMMLNSETDSQLHDNLAAPEPGMTSERQLNTETDHNAPSTDAPQPAEADRNVAETAPPARAAEMTDAARFEKALSEAESGNSKSQYEIGNMYMTGIGTDIDYGKAISFFEKSAAQGNNKAAYQLGLIYYEGSGVSSNKKTAFKWFSSAAENNNPAAQYYLGKLYAAGQGTKKDNKLALEWLSKAVDGGFDQARGELTNVQEMVSQEAAAASAKKKEAEAKKAAAIARAEQEARAKAEKAAADKAEKAKAAASARKKEEQKKAAAIARAEQEARAKAEKVAADKAEKAKAEKAAASARAKQEAKANDAAKKELTKNQQVPREEPGKAVASKAVSEEEAAKHNGLEVVMTGAWSRNNKPVAYLPSSINICRDENDKVICLSDDQIRESGGNFIKYQTSAIIENFDNKDKSFRVTYRNLVIDTTPVTGTELATGDQGADGGFKVKTGWGSPHTMDCSFKEGGTISCLKNNTHTLMLVNTQTATSGR